MRILAFDPGYERLGAAVLEKQQGKEKLLEEVKRTAEDVAAEKDPQMDRAITYLNSN